MFGSVVGVIKKKYMTYLGILKPLTIKGTSTNTLFAPYDFRIPKIIIKISQSESLSKWIIVSINSWPKDSRYPKGCCVQVLGEVGERDTENKVLLIKNDVCYLPFSKDVLDCVPKLPWNITDDVGVHIADVSHFIKPGTAIDAEAAMRGTTVYLVDKRIDMIPELSSNLCSLQGNKERFAFTVMWEMTEEAKVINYQYFKSIIKSKTALTYSEAQAKIDDMSLNDDISSSLRLLNELAKILKKKQVENGGKLSHILIKIPSLSLQPNLLPNTRETNSMVEEFMLLANRSVAEKILDEYKDCALLRRQPAPDITKFDPLIKAGLSKGFEIKVDSNKTLTESLENAVVPDNPYFNVMPRMVATRCMTRVLYFSSGVLSQSNYFHYGLAEPVYTHFTSPIRRYADVIVHRLLAAAIGADVTYCDLHDKNKIEEICTNINYRNRQAKFCERASVDLYTRIFLKDKVIEEDGYILFVKKQALEIIVPRFGFECTLDLSSSNNDTVTFTYDKKVPSQTANGVVLAQFDPVCIQLHIVQLKTMEVKLVKPQVPDFSVPSLSEEPPRKKIKISV